MLPIRTFSHLLFIDPGTTTNTTIKSCLSTNPSSFYLFDYISNYIYIINFKKQKLILYKIFNKNDNIYLKHVYFFQKDVDAINMERASKKMFE